MKKNIKTRRFDISEIARIWNVPLHLLQKTTGSFLLNDYIEKMENSYIECCLRPYLVKLTRKNKRFDKHRRTTNKIRLKKPSAPAGGRVFFV